MAVNSGEIDLNADSVLVNRGNEVMGFKSSGSNVSVGVSLSENVIGDSVGGDEVLVHDQKVCDVGDEGQADGSLDLVSELGVVGIGKEGFVEETELVGGGNGFEVGVEVVDGGCDGKGSEFPCRLVKNEDKESAIRSSDGYEEPCKGLECENASEVNENGLLSAEVVSNDEAQGVDKKPNECEQEVKNDNLGDLSTVMGDGGEMNAADSLIIKDDIEVSLASEVEIYRLQDCLPYMEDKDVNAKESLRAKDRFSRSCLKIETSYEVKQPAFWVDAGADVMRNQTGNINISEAGNFENVRDECNGLDLVVDLHSYRNMQEIGVYRESVFSKSNFCVSDLVWGKVRGHPWWPGQIFDPSDASKMAKRHLKEDCHLIAYFGDQTFAWNDSSTVKPFHMHFSELEKQTDLEYFQHAVRCALDEVSRRVEFGLSCPCMPEEMLSELRTQVITNAGICKQSSRINREDRFLNATSFEPTKLVNFVKSLAQSPLTESDGLDFVTSRAQLLAFYHSKGYSQLPEFTVLGGLFENDMEVPLIRENQQIDEQALNTVPGFSRKCKNISQNSRQPNKKHKLLADLMSEKSSSNSNGRHKSEQPGGDKFVARRRGRKRKVVYSTSSDHSCDSLNEKLTHLQDLSVDKMCSQLCSAAKDPAGESCSGDMVDFFAEFRNFCSLDASASQNQGMPLEQIYDGETKVTSVEAMASMTSAMKPCNDSYWTDRIIQSFSEEQSLSKCHNQREEVFPHTPAEANSHCFKLQPVAEINTDLGLIHQDTDRNLGSGTSKVMEHLDQSSKEATSPTALTLKFTNLDSVPSISDLNKIFGRFGPLIESNTELLMKTNRARVVFQRRSDAETAFSSAGKYSIFGPSLVSYRLKILSKAPKIGTGKRGRKSKKETSSVDGAAV